MKNYGRDKMAKNNREFPKHKRCPRCLKHPPNQSKRKDFHPAMSKMYIRIGVPRGSPWVQIGWFCRSCGKMMRLRDMDIN